MDPTLIVVAVGAVIVAAAPVVATVLRGRSADREIAALREKHAAERALDARLLAEAQALAEARRLALAAEKKRRLAQAGVAGGLAAADHAIDQALAGGDPGDVDAAVDRLLQSAAAPAGGDRPGGPGAEAGAPGQAGATSDGGATPGVGARAAG
jgi:flagellar basal body-associated protein FliL